MGLGKITCFETESALHLYAVGSGICGMIYEVLRKLENNSSTQLPYSLKFTTEIFISLGSPGVSLLSFSAFKSFPSLKGFKYHHYFDSLF